MIFLLSQYVLPISLSNNFENNIKQSYIWPWQIHEASSNLYARCLFNLLSNLMTCVLFVMHVPYCWNLWFACIICRWLSSKEIHKEDIKYWRREIPRLMCEMQSIYLFHLSMHKNTTSYTKLRRLKCVDLYTQGQCRWWRGTWNQWRLCLDKEHILRVLWWRDIWYINPWCILVNIFLT